MKKAHSCMIVGYKFSANKHSIRCLFSHYGKVHHYLLHQRLFLPFQVAGTVQFRNPEIKFQTPCPLTALVDLDHLAKYPPSFVC